MSPEHGPTPEGGLSDDPVRRVSQYQTAGVNARQKLFALLAAQGVDAGEADDLVAALESGAVAGAQSEVAELDGAAPASRGAPFADGWYDGVTAVSQALVGIADRDWARRCGRSAGAGELTVHLADARRRERDGLVRLETFVRESVLPSTRPYTTQRRRVLEALGEAGGLCPARTVESSSGDVIVCTREAGHYNPDDKPDFKDGSPGGWHHADGSIWNDTGALGRERPGHDAQEQEVPAELIGRVLAVCEEHYAAVTGTSPDQWDQESSREIVDIALRAVRLADRETYPQALDEYLVANRARLEQLWRVYGPAGVFPQGVYHLVELPGSFMLCERLKTAPMWIQGVWGRECESDTPLDRLREAWLYGTDKDGGR